MRWLARSAFSALAALAALLAIELICRWTAPANPRVEQYIEGLREYDAVLGYRAKAGTRVHAVKQSASATIFDVTYTLDQHGRRATPSDAGAPRSKFALFFGDSFTFGHGLEDDQTLPSRLAALAPEHRPYNYALPGYGPQHTLALLETRDLRAEIAEPTGLAVYTFIDPHVRRAIGSMREVRWQMRNAPYYVLRDDGTLERLGSFAGARRVTTKLYSLLAASSALERLDVELPRLSSEHFELTAALLARAAELARTNLGAEQFVVLFFPGATLAGRVAPLIESRGVRCLDYSSWSDPRVLERIAGDGHPTAAAYAAVAERLATDLALR